MRLIRFAAPGVTAICGVGSVGRGQPTISTIAAKSERRVAVNTAMLRAVDMPMGAGDVRVRACAGVGSRFAGRPGASDVPLLGAGAWPNRSTSVDVPPCVPASSSSRELRREEPGERLRFENQRRDLDLFVLRVKADAART